MTTPPPLELIQAAIAAADFAYVPYSHYRVGAVLRATDGSLYRGCNVENAAYPSCICAERTALVKAVSEGRQAFDLIVIATQNGGSPCGSCRQMLYEFAPDLRVVMVDFAQRITGDFTLRGLLPEGFGPNDLPQR
jgi:cytidine deaminase